MMYLVLPTGEMRWNGVLTDSMVAVVTDHGGDLSRVEWEPSEHRGDDTVVGLALRYGTATPEGIALDDFWAHLSRRPDELTEARDNAAQSQADRLSEQGALLEQLLPGSGVHEAELTARIDEVHERTLAEAIAHLDRVMQAREPDPALIRHWTMLGGRVPPI